MQELIRHLPAVIYEYAVYPDGTSRFLFISEACKSLLGLSPKSVMNDASVLDAIVHEDDRASLQETSLKSLQESAEWTWQGRMIVFGKVIWVDVRSNHELQTDGTIIRRGIIQDITDRKESAKETELRYLSLVERLPIGVVIHKNGKLLLANAQAHQILAAKKSKRTYRH